MFSYLLGEIDHEYYVQRSNSNAIEHPVLTYLFVILAAAALYINMHGTGWPEAEFFKFGGFACFPECTVIIH